MAGLNVSSAKQKEVYEKIQKAGGELLDFCTRVNNRIAKGDHTVWSAAFDLLNVLLGYSNLFVDSTAWPQEFKTKLKAYAIEQGNDASDYLTAYEALRAEISSAMAVISDALPRDDHGHLLGVKVDSNGAPTYVDLEAEDVAAIQEKINDIVAALG